MTLNHLAGTKIAFSQGDTTKIKSKQFSEFGSRARLLYIATKIEYALREGSLVFVRLKLKTICLETQKSESDKCPRKVYLPRSLPLAYKIP